VYLLWKNDDYYVVISANVHKRFLQHQQEDPEVQLLHHFKVPTRREAEGLEATLHHLQRQGEDVQDFFSPELFPLHTLWFNSKCKGYPKHLVSKPYMRF
jgi:hypothetical protein